MTTVAPPARRRVPRHPPMRDEPARSAADVPVVAAFVLSAVAWLVIGSVPALLASIKLHMPDFFGGTEWLTFGRVRPVHVCMALYGWGSLAGIAVLLWLATAHSGVRLPCARPLLGGCALWNVAVAAAAWALLGGAGTATSWPQLPALWTVVCGGVLLLVTWAVLALHARRRCRDLSVAQWYVLAAAIGFPFVLLTGGVLVQTQAARGLVHAILTAWLDQQLMNLWLTPIGLAAVYHVVPALAGRPLYSRSLAAFGFWTFVVIAPWSGPQRLTGGPVPAWIATIGTVATVLLLVPVAAVAVNLHKTLRGRWSRLRHDVALRFVVLGALAYTAASFQDAAQTLRPVDTFTHFTQCGVAQTHLGLYGFFTMVMCGAIYHLLPRISGRAALPRYLAEVHFWCAASGVVLYWLGLMAGGLVQGWAAYDPGTPFTKVLASVAPYFGVRSAAGYLLLTGHLVFAGCVLQLLAARREVRA